MVKTEDWAFIHIHKTSGVNFMKRACEQDYIINCHKSLPKYFNHQPLWWWEDNGYLNGQKIVTIVRNPYSRYVSLYNHIRENSPQGEIKPFDEFVLSNQLLEINRHFVGVSWRIEWQMKDFIKSNFSRDVIVFRYEDQLSSLEQYVGFKFLDTRYNSRNYPHWESFYTEELRDIIYSRYREDFNRFGYDKSF
jgi:hypothetical protein